MEENVFLYAKGNLIIDGKDYGEITDFTVSIENNRTMEYYMSWNRTKNVSIVLTMKRPLIYRIKKFLGLIKKEKIDWKREIEGNK